MERRRAHAGVRGERIDAQRARDVGPDPLDGAPDLRQPAAGDGELAEQRPVRSLEQAIEELALGERREHADVGRRVEQAQQPQQRRLQVRRERADAEPGPVVPAAVLSCAGGMSISRPAIAAGSSRRLTARYGARAVASITCPVTGRSAESSM